MFIRCYQINKAGVSIVMVEQNASRCDLGAKMIADAIGGGAVPNLEKLQVQFNLIEDPGCVALAEAISTGKVPKLQTFRINHNAIGDEGIAAIAEALESSKAPPIEELWLQGMKQVKGPGVKALGDVLARGCASTVHTVYLYEDQVDDEGAIAMAQALGSGKLPKMKELWLNDNRVSDATATALAAALKTGATPKLVQLKLMTNPSITEAGTVSGSAYPSWPRSYASDLRYATRRPSAESRGSSAVSSLRPTSRQVPGFAP